jgi:hypothetical protein
MGMLFGCDRHGWDKVMAWSRYLGAGYLARCLHLDTFPILRFQMPNDRQVRAFTSLTEPDLVARHTASKGNQPTVDINKQIVLYYVTIITAIATVVGTVATAIELVISLQ